MKKALIVTLISAFFITSCAHDESPDTSVPSVVMNSFQSQFQNASNTEWEAVEKNFEVEFELDGNDHTALINPKGEILKSKQDISMAELPSPVTAYINKEYSDKTIDDVEKITVDGEEYYQIEIERAFGDLKIVLTSRGKTTADVEIWD